MKTGQLIKELRLKKGITQEELAGKTDISVRTIQRIENGEVDPRAYTLQSIAAALEVDFEVLNDAGAETNDIEKNETSKWIPLLHLSGLLVLIIPPILVWIWKRDEVKDMRRHAVDVINFQLSMSLYALPFAAMMILPILIPIFLFAQVIIIINTVKVASNENYKYPLTIPFLKQIPISMLP